MKSLVLFMLVGTNILAECIPAKSFIKYPASTGVGGYQRVHPNGDYVLHSSMGFRTPDGGSSSRVVLFDLKNLNENGEAKPIMTPMNDEVYPIMSDWSLFASPNHNDGMRYYSLDKIIENKNSATPEFADRYHNEYYQSVGELSSSKTKKHIRVTLYSRRNTKDYELEMKDGAVVSQKELKKGAICENIVNPSTAGITSDERIRLNSRIQSLTNEYLTLDRERSTSNTTTERRTQIVSALEALRTEFNTIQSRMGAQSGENFGSPVLSVDGNEVAASRSEGASRTTKIYKINSDYSCELVDDLGFQTSKIQFSPPVAGKKGKIAFIGTPTIAGRQATSGIYVYDRDTKELKMISKRNDGSLGYPGFTKNGRVIYPVCRRNPQVNGTSCGAEIVDPSQIDNDTGEPKSEPSQNCIQIKGTESTSRTNNSERYQSGSDQNK